MVSLDRGETPTELNGTYNQFISEIAGLSVDEQYRYYERNKNRYKYNTQETKNAFSSMTGERCSFCTKLILDYNMEMTVEHIETKVKVPEKIFLWSNLLCSCKACNNKRSINEYDEELYLDPTSISNLEEYFQFCVDGTIKPSDNISVEKQNQVKYMINLYKLDRDDLKVKRRQFFLQLLDENYYAIIKNAPRNDFRIFNLALFNNYKKGMNDNE